LLTYQDSAIWTHNGCDVLQDDDAFVIRPVVPTALVSSGFLDFKIRRLTRSYEAGAARTYVSHLLERTEKVAGTHIIELTALHRTLLEEINRNALHPALLKRLRTSL
jgi:hypothetical protein